MATFAITEAAAREIKSRLEVPELERPVASLIDSSQSFSASAEMVEAITKNVGESEMFAIAMKEYSELASTLVFRLDVGVYEADDCPPQDLTLIDGLQFAMPKEMLDYLVDHVLDYTDGHFHLKSPQRTFLRLRDLEGGRVSAA